MAGEGEEEEAVFLGGAAANVVDDEGGAVGGFFIGDDHDVGELTGDGAGDEVAGEVVGFLLGDGKGVALALEVGAEVGDAAVVDAAVGALEAPDFWVGGEVGFHVEMDELLEVEARFSERADGDVGTDASVVGDVAIGVGKGDVSGVVAGGDADAGAGGGDDLLSLGCLGEDWGDGSGGRSGLLGLRYSGKLREEEER